MKVKHSRITQKNRKNDDSNLSSHIPQWQLDAVNIIENIPDAFLSFDKEYRYIYLNAQAEKLLGKTKEELIGKKVLDVFPHFKDIPAFKKSLEAIKAKKPMKYEYFSTLSNTWLQASFYPSDEGLSAYFTDLTSRIETETALKESEKRFRELADSMPQLVWTANAQGMVDYYNERRKDFTGIKKTKNRYEWAPIVHPEDLENTSQAWEGALKNKTIYEMEHRIKTNRDEYRWYLSRAIPVKDAQGNVIKWYGTATDIHANKIIEQQKGEFLSVASHELKTPVTSIKAYTQVMKAIFKKRDDAQAVSLLEKMDTQLNKLTGLIADLLDVTKIESGNLKLKKESFDFNSAIKEIIEQTQLTTSHHTITMQLGPSTNVYGDPDRLGQVIVNFLTNAIKYSPHADTIIVRSKVTQGAITFSVQDFGVGIPAEKQRHIFKRFYRVEGEKEEMFPGLGLGLFISSEIIKRHNGTIWFESKENIGSTFSFTIPLIKKKE